MKSLNLPFPQVSKNNNPQELEFPDIKTMEDELIRVRQQMALRKSTRNALFTLIVVAALAVLIATIFLPILRIYGSSMNPTLVEGDLVLTLKDSDFQTGDIVGVYVGNKLLVKRVIAGPGQWVDIDKNGTVYVNNQVIEEPYLHEKVRGECTVDLPYQVPEDKFFVLGDNRATSLDSRNILIGCVTKEQIVGRILFRIWPLQSLGDVKSANG